MPLVNFARLTFMHVDRDQLNDQLLPTRITTGSDQMEISSSAGCAIKARLFFVKSALSPVLD